MISCKNWMVVCGQKRGQLVARRAAATTADNVSILSSSLLASLSTSLIASGSNKVSSPSIESSDPSNSLIVPPSYSSSLSDVGIHIHNCEVNPRVLSQRNSRQHFCFAALDKHVLPYVGQKI